MTDNLVLGPSGRGHATCTFCLKGLGDYPILKIVRLPQLESSEVNGAAHGRKEGGLAAPGKVPPL